MEASLIALENREAPNASDEARRRAGPNPDAYALVYSVTDLSSLDRIPEYAQAIGLLDNADEHAGKPLCVLIANKVDSESTSKELSTGDGASMADKLGIPFYEVSAKTGEGVDGAFFELLRSFVRRRDTDNAGWWLM